MAMHRATLISVMIVVPTFAEREHGNPPSITAVIFGLVVSIAPRWHAELTAQVTCKVKIVRTRTPQTNQNRQVEWHLLEYQLAAVPWHIQGS